jgi:hypothetical protein
MPAKARNRYVPNRKLGISRAPSGFSLYLASISGKFGKYTKRRVTGKTSFFRMDLLKSKYNSLDASCRSEFEMAAKSEVDKNAAERLKLLNDIKVVCPAVAEDPRPAIADAPEVGPTVAGSSVVSAVAGSSVAPAVAGSTLVFSSANSSVQKVYTYITSREYLGAGSFGKCFIARAADTGERCCAKLANTDSAGEQSRTALRAEFAIMIRMNHPNVMRGFGLTFDSIGNATALLMPVMTNNLWKFAHTTGFESEAVVTASGMDRDSAIRSCMLQLVSGLAHMHGHDVFHLDLKPENVLVRCIAVASVLEFQISDFGNAQTTTTTVDGVPCSKTIAPRWVQSDVYRPFELLGARSNVPLIPRYDIWALGCIFWDVAHTPRLRSPGDGGHLRLASTYVSGDGAPDLERLWMARNGRVSKRLPRHLASIVNKMQPRDLSRRCQTNLVEVDADLRRLPDV